MTTWTPTPESKANAEKTLAEMREAIRRHKADGMDAKGLALAGDVYFALQRQMTDAGDID